MSVSGARLLAIAAFAAIAVAPLALANESADRAAIEAAAQTWIKAFNARDANALLALATDDLILLNPNSPPATGARAREVWKKWVGGAQGPLTSTSKEIVVAGEVAWRIASLGDAKMRSQVLEIWKRVGGEWKIHRQMSSNLLTPGLVPAPTEPVLDRPAN
jgi:ketosteroid isomerase-like protein